MIAQEYNVQAEWTVVSDCSFDQGIDLIQNYLEWEVLFLLLGNVLVGLLVDPRVQLLIFCELPW